MFPSDMASSGLWTILPRFFKAEVREVGDSPELYLRLTRECMEQADGMTKISTLPKLNYEQCKYLSDKLKMVVQSANSFLELIKTRPSPSISAEDKMVQPLEIFKLLFVLGKEVESFIGGCCKDPWIQSAIMLANASEHVSSLGMNLEIFRIGFSNMEKSGELLALKACDFVSIKEAEVPIIKERASLDEWRLIEAVSGLMQSCESHSIDWQLAKFVRERLERERLKTQREHLGSDLRVSDVSTYIEILDKGLNQGPRLGGGTFGSVYKAKWFGADVAKKTFHGVSVEDFFHEVSILEGLRHPNIVSLLWYMKGVRKCYLIMELMDKDLLSLIQERLEACGTDDPPFSILEALHIMLQVGEGMLFLHEKRIVHRDLKSQNILVRYVKSEEVDVKYVQAKVADFGLSRTKDKSTTTSLLTLNQGTTRWMAPELIKTANDDGTIELSKCEERLQYPFKVDVYSFGMLCYEILSGKVPFSGDSVAEVRKRVLAGDRPELPDQCPERLTTLIKKCWSLDPSKRPRFDDICAELRHLIFAHFLAFDRPRVQWKWDRKQAISDVPSPCRGEGAIPSQQSSLNEYCSKEILEENVDMTDGVEVELGQGRVDEEHKVEEFCGVKTTLLVAGGIVLGLMTMVLIFGTFVAKILSPFKRLAIDSFDSVLFSISPSTVLVLFCILVVGVSTGLLWKLSDHRELTSEDAEGAIPSRQRDALVALDAIPLIMAVPVGQSPEVQSIINFLRENGDVDLANAAAGLIASMMKDRAFSAEEFLQTEGVLEAGLNLLDSNTGSPGSERMASTILEMAKEDARVRIRIARPGLRGLDILVQYVRRDRCNKKIKELLTATLVLFCRDGEHFQDAVIEANGDTFLVASLQEEILREEAAQGLLELLRNPVRIERILKCGFVRTAMGSISQTFACTAIAQGLSCIACTDEGLNQIYSASSDSALRILLENCSDGSGQDAAASIIRRLFYLLSQRAEDLPRLNNLISETCPGLVESLKRFDPNHVKESFQALAAFATHMWGKKIIYKYQGNRVLMSHLSTRDIEIQGLVLKTLSRMTSDVLENGERMYGNTTLFQDVRDIFFRFGPANKILEQLLSLVKSEEFRWPGRTESMKDALIILRNLSLGGPSFCNQLVDQGAVNALLIVLNRPGSLSVIVTMLAVKALEKLLDGSKGKQAFMSEGGIESLVAILKADAFVRGAGRASVSSSVLTLFVGSGDGKQTGFAKDINYRKPAFQAIYECDILPALSQIIFDDRSPKTKWKAALMIRLLAMHGPTATVIADIREKGFIRALMQLRGVEHCQSMANSVLEYLGSKDARLKRRINDYWLDPLEGHSERIQWQT